MANSTVKCREKKATKTKPRPDFPLSRHHHTGRWYKKVRGKFCYFGKLADDPDGQKALAIWLEQKDDLLAGRPPRPKRDGGLTLKDLGDNFLTTKKLLVDSGEIAARTYSDYHITCQRMADYWGKDRTVESLTPDDFSAYRAHLANGWGPKTLANEITRCRVVLKFAADQQLIERPVAFGQGFKKPSAKVLRKHRAANGAKMLEPPELRAIIEAASQPLKAMILLALNGGLGNTDVSELQLTTLQEAIGSGWLNYPRVKTGVARRIPLWPETVEACREAIEQRRASNGEPWAFLTLFRAKWVTPAKDNASAEFTGLLRRPRCPKCGRIEKETAEECSGCKWEPRGKAQWETLHRKGLSFYTLRRCFQTAASNETGDEVATSAIMGHVPAGMAAVYRQRVDDARLKRVTDAVRAWLFGVEGGEG